MYKESLDVIAFGIGSLEIATRMASTSPPKVLGLYGRKRDIDIGFYADVLRLSAGLEVLAM